MVYKPLFRIEPRLLSLITEITELKSWISRSTINVAWVSHLQFETTTKLAHSSTSIEGNPLDLHAVEAIARGDTIVSPAQARQEVLNYIAALKWIWKKTPGSKIAEEGLLKLHAKITHKILPKDKVGRYKTKNNRIIDHKGHTVYTPPSPEETPALMNAFCQWLNSSDSTQLHPIIVSAIVHHRLVSIHPFSDGNGRAARASAIWLLYNRGFDTQHLFALDMFFEKDRARYYKTIQQARDLDDDLTYWIEYVTQGVLETLVHTKERILSLSLRSNTRIHLTKRQEDILRFLKDRGSVKSGDLEAAFKITRARVSQLVSPLVTDGLIKRDGKSRATTYRLMPTT